MSHRRLVCRSGRCDGIIAVLPVESPAKLARSLGYGQDARTGFMTAWCPRCRCKWEVGLCLTLL